MNTEAISVRSRAVAEQETTRFIYVFMAVLFVVVAVAGFAPRSVAIVMGERPVPQLIVHLHAAMMSAWLVLFLAQTLLMASGRAAVHRSLGMASFVIAPAMFFTMAALVIGNFSGTIAAVADPAAAIPAEAAGRAFAFQIFIMSRALILFGLFYAWAVLTRKTDRETHKRMMVLATFIVIDASLGRMTWLPGTSGGNFFGSAGGYDATHLYQLLLLVPVLVYDIVRFKRVHWAYVLGLALFLSCVVGAHFAWNSPAWHAMVVGLAGG